MSNQLIPIMPAAITIGPIDFDLYAKEGIGKMVLFARKGLSITNHHLDMLNSLNRTYYITDLDSAAYYDYSLSRLHNIVEDENIHPKIKMKFLNDVGKHSINSLLLSPEQPQVHKNVSKIVDHHLDMILKDPEVTLEIFKLTSMDSYTYSHSINVGIMNVLLFQTHTHASRKELKEIGMAGVLHDIGKVYCDQEIMQRPYSLSLQDFVHIKKHTNFSLISLDKHNYSQNIKDACLYHHERLDGAGYPSALKNENIPLFAKVTAINDVFDALTSKRVYKEPISHLEALQIMYDDVGHFDENIFLSLLKVVLQNDILIDKFLDSKSRHRLFSQNH